MVFIGRGEWIRRFGTVLIICICTIALVCCKSRRRAKSVILPPGSEYTADEFAGELESMLTLPDTSAQQIARPGYNINTAYFLNDYEPIWSSKHSVESFLEELEQISWDGLNPEHYHFSELKKMYADAKGKFKSVDKAIAFDTMCTAAYIAAAHDLLIGRIVPKSVDSLWYHTNDSTWNVSQLLVNNDKDYPSLNTYRSKFPTYKTLREACKRYMLLAADTNYARAMERFKDVSVIRTNDSATIASVNYIIKGVAPWLEGDTVTTWDQLIKGYQTYLGLKTTGNLDTATVAKLYTSPAILANPLKINMERIRWTQQDYGDLYLLVNIPLMELFLRKDGIDAMHMNVVVGKPVRQTPVLNASMANVVINPPWGVPPTIMKKDVLPGLLKSGQAYLNKKGLQAYDHKGNKVDASNINANNYKRYIIKQAPGDDNALGYVKFNLPNKWDIYLHDTPHREDFPKKYRALSSGCIRVQQPQEMALYILADLEGKRYTQERLDSVISTHKTRWEILKNKIPVHILYLTAFEDDTHSHEILLPDIYKRDAKLLAMFN